uniref:Uncharacterized protein n=1 Tax=Peronospora matthiolae TaxID=2874970 RepID=A0AAV1VDW2_9STRA
MLGFFRFEFSFRMMSMPPRLAWPITQSTLPKSTPMTDMVLE